MSLSSGSPGSILFWMPSRPAIIIAANARYGLHVGSGKRTSMRRVLRRRDARHRDADRRRAVAARVGEVDRRLEARHETAVAVRRRVRERGERLGVLDDAADVAEADVARGRRSRRRRRGACPPSRATGGSACPLPLSPKSGFGMNVAVLPCFRATFFTTYLNHISLSAITARVEELACRSRTARRSRPRGGRPRPRCRDASSVSMISVRRLASVSVGGTGK